MILFLQIVLFILIVGIGLAGVVMGFVASFWATDSNRPWLWIPLIILGAIVLVALSVALSFGAVSWFGWGTDDARSHCGYGTTYVESSHTVLMPISTGKTITLVPETITDWQCIVKEDSNG